MRDAAEVLDKLIGIGDQIRHKQAQLDGLKRDRDDLIFEANESFNVPISTICTALGLRRDTVVHGKLKAQARYVTDRQLAEENRRNFVRSIDEST